MPHGTVRSEPLHVINLARDPDDVLDLLTRSGRRHVLWQGGDSFDMLADAPLLIILDEVDSEPRGPGQGMPLALGHLAGHEAESIVIVPDVSLEAEHALLRAGALEVIPRENLTPQALDRALRRAGLRLSLRQEGERAGSVAASLLDRIPLAVVFVRRNASIVHANAKAQALLAREGALFRTPDGMIAARRSEDHRRLTHAIEMLSAGDPGQESALTIEPDEDAGGLSVILVPAGLRRGGVALFIADLDDQLTIDEGRLAELYGLTAAEARVLAGLAQGQPLEDIAERHGLKVATVRQHLKAVFFKMGVRRQSDAIKMVLTGPAVITDPTPAPAPAPVET